MILQYQLSAMTLFWEESVDKYNSKPSERSALLIPIKLYHCSKEAATAFTMPPDIGLELNGKNTFCQFSSFLIF